MISQSLFEKNRKKNIKAVLLSQVFSNFISLSILLLGLFYLESEKYLEIQLTLTYLVFSGFIHLGIIDGLELRIAGKSISKNNYGALVTILFFLSLVPFLFYLILNYNGLKEYILIALLAFPLINLNTFLIVLLRSYGFSWIAAYGNIVEKILTLLYIFLTAKYSVDLIKFFIFFPILPLLYFIIQLRKIGVQFDFGINRKQLLVDFKNGSVLMLSNILYSIVSSGSIIVASNFYSNDHVSRLAISISFINLFVGVSSQVSSVIFPLMSSQFFKDRESSQKSYNEIFERYVPFLLIFLVCILYISDNFFKELYTKENILKYVFVLIPVVYFEVKNQIINIVIIKLRMSLKPYLTISLLSVLFSTIILILSSYFFSTNFYIFLYSLICGFIFRFILVSFYCQTLKWIDSVFIVSFFIYLAFLSQL